jgi:hypothetical protein
MSVEFESRIDSMLNHILERVNNRSLDLNKRMNPMPPQQRQTYSTNWASKVSTSPQSFKRTFINFNNARYQLP